MQTRSTLKEAPPAILHGGIYQSGSALSAIQPWPFLQTSLFCCPSITAQALRAAMVAAELPLRGKLRAEATIFSTDECILEVLYECLQTLLRDYIIKGCHARIAPCSTHGQNCRRLLRRSAGCLLPTSNPAARAARAVPRPTNISKRGALRRQTPISRVRTYC